MDQSPWKSNISRIDRTTAEHGSALQKGDRSRKTVRGGVGPVAGVSAAWMRLPSPQGRVHGVPRNRTHPALPRETRCCCCCCC
ncbi:hypothetical protein DI041_11240 [Stenotrophomonas maltophilia]|nr:hypothetical protein DI041_11240 [Stenotrophomonas maltophilia]